MYKYKIWEESVSLIEEDLLRNQGRGNINILLKNQGRGNINELI